MKIMISSLVGSNIDPRIVEGHKKVCEHFNIPVSYFYQEHNIDHGLWMDNILRTYEEPDIFGFFDIDCVPLKRDAVSISIEMAKRGYLIGPAQTTNCIKEKYHIFASPAFLFISKNLYRRIGSPSCVNNPISDTAQELTRHAEKQQLPYRYWIPTKFEKESSEGIWRLAGYGYYGVGTVYGDNMIYHLYESRKNINAELFSRRCEEIINNKFDSSKFYSCVDEYRGILKIANDVE